MYKQTIAARIRDAIYSKDISKPIRAVFYGRVSTENESQKDSCENQLILTQGFIKNHPNIILVDCYIDDGISGKSTDNRPEFMKMLSRIEHGDIDLIITKSTSRLHRNQATALFLINLLIENEATILTVEDGQVHDFEDDNSMILHSLINAIDAQYVRQQSKYGKLTHQIRCDRKELSAKDISFGYDWNRDSKTITINEEERSSVTSIFEDYVYKSMTPAEIAKSLNTRGVINRFSAKAMTAETITNIIKDERYIGTFYINKRGSTLGLNGKSTRYKLSKEEWIPIYRPELQIVDKDLFNIAQRVMKSRKTIYNKPDKKTVQAQFEGFHDFAGKVFCANCNKPYHFGYADRAKTKAIYRIKSHSSCNNHNSRISEEALYRITQKAIQMALQRKQEAIVRVRKILLACISDTASYENEIKQINHQITRHTHNIDKWSIALTDSVILSNEVAKLSLLKQINEEENLIKSLQNEKQALESKQVNSENQEEEINKIQVAIDELQKVKIIDRDKIKNYIERILLHADGHIDVILKAGITYSTNIGEPFSSPTGGDSSSNKSAMQNSVVKTQNEDDPYSLPAAYLTLLPPAPLQQ